MFSAAVLLLLAVMLMSIIGFGVLVYAMCLMSDLQCDYINPYAFVDRLNWKLKSEAWMHVPMLCCCGSAGYPIGCVAIAASAGYRYWLHQRNDVSLDPTMVFRASTQSKLWTRWTIMLLFHVAAFFYIVVRCDRSPLPSLHPDRASGRQHRSRRGFFQLNAALPSVAAHPPESLTPLACNSTPRAA